MARILTVALGAACALVFMTAPPASAKLTTCESKVYYEVYRVKNVSCEKAAAVLKRFFAEQPTRGFTCRAKDTPSTFIVCRKGANKKIEYESE